jgi:glycosyltransferase involved in cell wall biosynthesis
MSDHPSVDLLVPVYKAERFLPRLERQLLNLDPPFTRVLIYDDASPDGTFGVFDQAGLSPIRGDRNLGPGGARNALAALSKSDWIHFHDVDDEIAPDYLSHLLPFLTSDIDMIIHDVRFIDELTRRAIITFSSHAELEDDPIRSLLIKPMGTTSSVIRREFFLKSGGFNEVHRCFEDGDMHLRLALSGARVRRMPLVLETSLRHQDGVSADMAYCHRCRLEFLESYINLLPARLVYDLATEFLNTAFALVSHGENRLALRSIEICRRLGGCFPQTDNQIIQFLTKFLPDIAILKLQNKARQCAKMIESRQPRGAAS